MCFTPAISLTTALIEFIIATFILVKYKRYVVPVFFAILVYVLGIYQFTEFMLCTTNNAFLWAKLGFITYTFLPAIGLHFAFRLTKKVRSTCFLLLCEDSSFILMLSIIAL